MGGQVYGLRLLATSDLHANLMPFDYARGAPLPNFGLARTATLIRAARAEAEALGRETLLVDNGDFLEGTPLGALAATGGRLAPGRLHPVIAAMNRLRYDVATLGNHDFSLGLDFLDQALAGAAFPVISANAVTWFGPEPLRDRHYRPPVALVTRRLSGADGRTADLRIGVLGLLPPQTENWEARTLAGRIATRDILVAAAAWVPELRRRGADIVVALCHSGIGPPEPGHRMENAALALAAVPGLDVIVAGHTHLAFPGPDAPVAAGVDGRRGSLSGKPAVMAGFWGSHLGVVDLDLAPRPDGWRVQGFRCEARPVARRNSRGKATPVVRIDPDIAAATRAWHRRTVAFCRAPIGRTEVPIHSYFARVADSPVLRVIHDAQQAWLDETVRGTPFDALPRLSAASVFKCGGRGGPQHFTDIPAGDVARGAVGDIYVFPNAIRALVVKGGTVRDWLDRAAAQFCQLVPGVTDQPLIEPGAPAYNFDVIDGLAYEIDLTLPSRFDVQGGPIPGRGSRIRNLCRNGAPVDPEARFLIVTNSYRANGGGQFPGLAGRPAVAEPLTLTADVIAAHIARVKVLAPRPHHTWRLAPLPPGTGAWFDTGPGARDHMGDDTGLTLEPLGDTAEGFLRFRVRF